MTDPQAVVLLVTAIGVSMNIAIASWAMYDTWTQKVRESRWLLEQGWRTERRLRLIVLADRILGG